MKAFDVPTMVEANRQLAAVLDERGTPYPLHLGVTEAGPPPAGRRQGPGGSAPQRSGGRGVPIRV